MFNIPVNASDQNGSLCKYLPHTEQIEHADILPITVDHKYQYPPRVTVEVATLLR